MSVVLACGGIFTLVAAYLTSRIKDQIELPEGMRAEQGEGASRPVYAGSRRGSEAGLVSNERIGGLEY
jgi:solute carrier family 45 protein 1/2/4